MTEILGIYAFLLEKLSTVDINNIIAGRVFADVVPPIDDITKLAPVYPLIIFSTRTANDLTLLGGESGYLTAIVDVKIITDDSLSGIVALDSLVFQALHRSGAVIVDGANRASIEIMGCYRTGHVITSRVDADKNYRYSVHTYTIRAARIAEPVTVVPDLLTLWSPLSAAFYASGGTLPSWSPLSNTFYSITI